MATKTISIQELQERTNQDSNVTLIDVRTPVEFREVHVEFAKNIPLDSLDVKEMSKQHNVDQSLYVICRGGGRGAKAAQRFSDAGFENVFNVEGGTQAWADAGLPVRRGKKAVSLERQVRIVAGTIVFVSALLAMFIHPYFAGICAFVGAGLAFAGITDTCLMGTLLAKMPWNRIRSNNSCAMKPQP